MSRRSVSFESLRLAFRLESRLRNFRECSRARRRFTGIIGRSCDGKHVYGSPADREGYRSGNGGSHSRTSPSCAAALRLEKRAEVARDLRAIFSSIDHGEAQNRLKITAQKWEKTSPKLSAWMEANILEALTVFQLPEKHRRRLRTTNALERRNLELKRRTRVALIFPNESALERLVTALLMEQSELSETDKTYLNMEN